MRAAVLADVSNLGAALIGVAGAGVVGVLCVFLGAWLQRRADRRRDRAAAAADARVEQQAANRAELQRRGRVLAQLRQEWITSHDGISPEMLAGTEPLPKPWVDQRLHELGETWRQEVYR